MSYSSMKLPELKEELKKRGLLVSGKKDDLVKRLKENDEEKGKDNQEEADKESKKEEKKEAKKEDDGEEKKDRKGKGKRKLDAEDKEEEEEEKEEKSSKAMKKSEDDDAAVNSHNEGILKYLKDPEWNKALSSEFDKPYFKKIVKFLEDEKKAGRRFFPPENQVFSALNYTPLDKVKVVIIGQDPYHDDGQANGLCFSVSPGVAHPPSLRNIFEELTKDISGFKTPKSGSLEKWAERGVLLLNATLTVAPHEANAHKDCGWQVFTDAVINVVNKKLSNVVFILWGGFAQKKAKGIDKNKHHIIAAAHPSPLSVTKFRGCKVFSKTNDYLKSIKKDPIDWTL